MYIYIRVQPNSIQSGSGAESDYKEKRTEPLSHSFSSTDELKTRLRNPNHLISVAHKLYQITLNNKTQPIWLCFIFILLL